MEECGKAKYLKPCPNDQAYNRCETVIKKNGEGIHTTLVLGRGAKVQMERERGVSFPPVSFFLEKCGLILRCCGERGGISGPRIRSVGGREGAVAPRSL